MRSAGVRVLALLLWGMVWSGATPARSGERPLERSYWVHASLGLFTQKGYFGPDYPATPPPNQAEIKNAARMLSGPYGANRLYLIYHGEMPAEGARRVFRWWREACPADVEVVPTLVLRMYDPAQTPVFAPDALRSLVRFFRREVNPVRAAVYDIYPNRSQGEALDLLAREYPRGLIRLGLQPDEALKPPFTAAAEDTWSGFCHGRRNEADWQQPGFGAETLRKWVGERNAGTARIAWNLIVVAWDYRTTERGAFPGYDDAEKNMPLPARRNRLGAALIREAAQAGVLGGFSSDLYILNENSRSAGHDGRTGAFYETLKRGEEYRGFYARPFQEITAIYQELKSTSTTGR